MDVSFSYTFSRSQEADQGGLVDNPVLACRTGLFCGQMDLLEAWKESRSDRTTLDLALLFRVEANWHTERSEGTSFLRAGITSVNASPHRCPRFGGPKPDCSFSSGHSADVPFDAVEDARESKFEVPYWVVR